MSEEYFAKQQYTDRPEGARPASLTILCILSMIWGGLSAFANLMVTLFYDMIIMGAKQLSGAQKVMPDMAKSFEEMRPMIDYISSLPRFYFFINIILSAGSFYGALMMWRLNKIGFHFYTASQLGMIIMTMIFIGISFSSFGTYITIIFIVLYAMNLKYMVR
jgi:hypothetical protein